MKAYTDLEQSKKLAEILPFESADMVYVTTGYSMRVLPKEDMDANTYPKVSPCWSFVALFDVLPEGIIENYYVPNMQKEDGKYSIAYGKDELLCIADNPVDACYEMILKLYELNLL